MSTSRLKSWQSFDDHERTAASDDIAGLAVDLDDRLRIFAARRGWEEEQHTGPLAHMPVAAKDMLVAPDHTPACGFAKPVKGLVQGKHAFVLQRLAANGTRRLGFTNMTTLAYEPSGYNALRPYPLNPWNVEFATGGSSSGSAVAVASGAAVVAIGSDTGGSVRIPAACCGVTGWKPTRGLIPLDGAMVLVEGLDTLGLLARDAADITRVAPALIEDFPDMRLAPPPSRVLVLSDLIAASEPAVRRACREALDAFETLGLKLDQQQGARALEVIDVPLLAIMQGQVPRTHRWLLDADDADPMLARRIEKGLAVTDEQLAKHKARGRRLLRDFLEAYLPEDTCLALPTLPLRTPPLVHTTPGSPTFSGRTLYEISRYTRFANYLGLPAVSVPVGFDDRGLPVGLQLVGRRGADAALLAMAISLQSITDWHGRCPAVVADTFAKYPSLVA